MSLLQDHLLLGKDLYLQLGPPQLAFSRTSFLIGFQKLVYTGRIYRPISRVTLASLLVSLGDSSAICLRLAAANSILIEIVKHAMMYKQFIPVSYIGETVIPVVNVIVCKPGAWKRHNLKSKSLL